MKSLPKSWKNKPYSQEEATKLQQELKINPIFCQLLVQRGIKSYAAAKAFFRPQLSDLHDPFLMKDMSKAVERLTQAIVKKEKIILYGDYDVDGTTAVALCYNFLQKYHSNLEFYIPDRYTEGYGVSLQGVEWAAARGATLWLVLDCGIQAHQAIALANQNGLDTIVIDHHLPAPTLPPALAILNPKQAACNYPYSSLSGAALAFKFMLAFAKNMKLEESEVLKLLDIVAVSIACDFVPLTGENRVLMYLGLERLNQSPCLGLAQLMKMLNRAKIYTLRDIVFGIGPHLNAAGRLAHARLTVELLTATTEEAATNLVGQLATLNQQRRDLEQQIVAEAKELVKQKIVATHKKAIIIYQAHWHKGVIGIVAARMVDTFHQPAIVLCLSGNKIVGSARTVADFDIHQALAACQDYLVNFGGHSKAAGLTLEPAQLENFSNHLEAVVADTIRPEQLLPSQKIDSILNLEDITSQFWNILKQFEPFGPQNMRPVFASTVVNDTGYCRLLKEQHLRLKLTQNKTKPLSAIAFNSAESYPIVQQKQPFNVCYIIEENTYKNKTSLQLNIRGILP